MKKYILKAFMLVALGAGMTSCGDTFLETDYYSGIDTEDALTSISKISTALNGTYYNLYHYSFAGNYAINIGDIPTDLSYWNGKTGHFDGIYTFTIVDTDTYLNSIWKYGYKVADNAARIIEAIPALYENATEEEKAELELYLAEAYSLRGYAQLMLTNIFCHQIKVNGTDFSSEPGIVVINTPIPAFEKVSRSTIGQSYEAVLSDLNNAISHFDAAGGDRGQLQYFGKAAVYGLLARTNLYMENWDAAMSNAQNALDAANISTLTYGNDNYKALYNSETSNTESMFALAITASQNWSANSSGTLWSSYNYSPSPKLQALYGENDCRTSIFAWDSQSTPEVPKFKGGKFSHFSSGNPAYATNYIVNAPEMFLIIAEANLYSANGTINNAQKALLTVAKRNSDITSVGDLPSTKENLMSFIKDERARELFQEGLRLYDLRRWDEMAKVNATQAPNISFVYTNYKISNLVFPIPSAEVNTGYGVAQNENWSSTLPQRN